MKSNRLFISLILFLLTGCGLSEPVSRTSLSEFQTETLYPVTDQTAIVPASTPGEQIPADTMAGILTAFSDDSSRNLLVLVNPRLRENLTKDLAVLEADLRNEQWTPAVSALTVNSPEELRRDLQTIFSRRPFAGIFLVGDFPFPRMWGYAIENPDQPGAADYFYMDLDGGWLDTNGDGFYDAQTGGQGDRQPEVFVGRLAAGSVQALNLSELEMIRAYLRRDHEYRTGNTAISNTALYSTYAHTLYGWVGAENAQWTKTEILQSIQALFSGTDAFFFDETSNPEDSSGWTAEFWPVNDPNQKEIIPARDRFREIMGAGYGYLSIGIHGTPDAWGPAFFTSRDVVSIHESNGRLPVLIFSASCSTANISIPDNLGGILTMAGNLVFVGFSAPSEMRWREFVSWNHSLADSPVGTAFRTVQAEATPDGYGAVTRNVNWILLGDPTLRIRTE